MLRVKLSERLKVFVASNSLFKERSENKKQHRKFTKKIKSVKISFIIIFHRLLFHSI